MEQRDDVLLTVGAPASTLPPDGRRRSASPDGQRGGRRGRQRSAEGGEREDAGARPTGYQQGQQAAARDAAQVATGRPDPGRQTGPLGRQRLQPRGLDAGRRQTLTDPARLTLTRGNRGFSMSRWRDA